jgi:copper chaperone
LLIPGKLFFAGQSATSSTTGIRFLADLTGKNLKMKTKIYIQGMSCQHCKMRVEKTLASIPGIESFQVNLETGEAEISGKVDLEVVLREINQTGYRASLTKF